jgi:hypothetical protein
MFPTIAELSGAAVQWHGVLIKLLKRAAPATRITVDLDKEIRGMLPRNEEITWELIQEANEAILELTGSMFQFQVKTVTIEGTDVTRLTSGPLWQLVELTSTADEDWTVEDETTWTPEILILEVGSWWRRPKDLGTVDPRQMIFAIPEVKPEDHIQLF